MSFLRRVFRICYSKWQYLMQIKAWGQQYQKCLRESYFAKQVLPLEQLSLNKVLILCPHADDEWIGCSSIIKTCKTVDVLYYRLYGYNTNEDNRLVRDQEIKQCSCDNHFTLITSDCIDSTLSELLAKNQYDAIIAPSPIDWHWEHRYVFDTLVEALSTISFPVEYQVLLYHISVPCVESNEVYASYLDENVQIYKWRYFDSNYVSQKMPDKRYMLQERLNAINTGYYAAELYKKISTQELLMLSRYIHNSNSIEFLDSLKSKINNIYSIRKVGEQLNYERNG